MASLKQKIKNWIVRFALTEEERRMLYGMRLGFESMQPKETVVVKCSVDLNKATREYLHSADGIREFDPVNAAKLNLLIEKQAELADLVSYREELVEETGLWKCTSWIEVVRR